MSKISSAEFLEMSHPVASMQWKLPVVPKTTGGLGSLFGGAGLAAGVVALEQATEKPLVWATGQYLSITQQPVTLDLEVTLPAIGRNVIQGRAVGHLDDKEIITILGACGVRPNVAEGDWQEMPDVKNPEDCPVLERDHEGETIHDFVDVRIEKGMFGFSGTGDVSGDNNNRLWARMPDVEHDAGALAIIADYMPSALGNALGEPMGCTSLDNTIRIANRTESEWILLDNTIEFAANGFGYGKVNMWSDSGVLMATASQSVIVRPPRI